MSQFNAVQSDAILRATRPMTLVGLSMVDILNDLYAGIGGLTAGSTALGTDVDSICLGGGAFTIDPDTTTGLTLGYQAGRFHNGMSEVNVAAGTILCTASVSNYIEVDRSGTVHCNTSGFTAGRMPIYTILAGASTLPNPAVSAKPFMTLIGPAGVLGVMLSTPGQTKELSVFIGAVPNTGPVSFAIIAPNVAATVSAVLLGNGTAVAQSDTNYWTFAAIDLGAGGSGSTALLNTGPVNTTKVTGGSALAAGVAAPLALTATTGNLNTAANDVLVFTLTPTGSPTALTLASVRIDFTFTT